MRRLGAVLLLAAAIGLGTWFGGWWAVPVIAGGWQLLRRQSAPAAVAVGALLGWGGLLALLPAAPLGRLVGRLAGVFHLPLWGTWGIAPVYAALLGWSAARLVAAIGRRASVTVPASQR